MATRNQSSHNVIMTSIWCFTIVTGLLIAAITYSTNHKLDVCSGRIQVGLEQTQIVSPQENEFKRLQC